MSCALFGLRIAAKNDVVAAERHGSAVQLLYAVLEHGGLFVQTDDVFSIEDDVLLAVGNPQLPSNCFPASQKVLWVNPARTSSN